MHAAITETESLYDAGFVMLTLVFRIQNLVRFGSAENPPPQHTRRRSLRKTRWRHGNLVQRAITRVRRRRGEAHRGDEQGGGGGEDDEERQRWCHASSSHCHGHSRLTIQRSSESDQIVLAEKMGSSSGVWGSGHWSATSQGHEYFCNTNK
jgi:hypothetical protein